MGLVEILALSRVPAILLLGTVYGAYVLTGGVIFWKLEGNLGREDIGAILARKQQVLKTYQCLNSEGMDAVIAVSRPSTEEPCDLAHNAGEFVVLPWPLIVEGHDGWSFACLL